jgi:predicted nuclease with TOPRIM domain
MELLYYISGVLSVGLIYGVILLRNVKSSHTDLLARYQSQTNISSLREADKLGEIEDLKTLVRDIQSNMEKDQYENLSSVNKQLESLSNLANETKSKLGESNVVLNKNITDAFNEIMQLKTNLKALSQDPNMLSRY